MVGFCDNFFYHDTNVAKLDMHATSQIWLKPHDISTCAESIVMHHVRQYYSNEKY